MEQVGLLHARGGRHLVHAHALEAAGEEELLGLVQDALAAGGIGPRGHTNQLDGHVTSGRRSGKLHGLCQTLRHPPGGEPDHLVRREAQRPRPSDHSLHRGRRHRAATSGAPRVRVFDAAVAKAYGGKRKIAWIEVLAGEKAFNQTGDWLPDDDARRLPRVPGRHQGPAHDAGRRRHPLAQRRAAPDARPLRLPAPGALVHGRAEPGEAARATSTW